MKIETEGLIISPLEYTLKSKHFKDITSFNNIPQKNMKRWHTASVKKYV